MLWMDAAAVVAAMADDHAFRDRPVLVFPHRTVGHPLLALMLKGAVAALIDVTRPAQAAGSRFRR